MAWPEADSSPDDVNRARLPGGIKDGMASVGVWNGKCSSGSGDFGSQAGSSSDDRRGGARSRLDNGISGGVELGNCGSGPYDIEDGENIDQGLASSCCAEKELSGGGGTGCGG